LIVDLLHPGVEHDLGAEVEVITGRPRDTDPVGQGKLLLVPKGHPDGHPSGLAGLDGGLVLLGSPGLLGRRQLLDDSLLHLEFDWGGLAGSFTGLAGSFGRLAGSCGGLAGSWVIIVGQFTFLPIIFGLLGAAGGVFRGGILVDIFND